MLRAGGIRTLRRRTSTLLPLALLAFVLPTALAGLDPALPEAGCGERHDALLGPFLPGGGEESHACWGKIRPGARMTAPVGCTMNWIVRDAAGALYIGTAGHCVGLGATVAVDGVGVVGTVAWRAMKPDFALVRIDPAKYDRVDPTLCHWGGPAALGTTSISERLLVYGFGTIYGSTAPTRARAGSAWFADPAEITYVGMMQPGDSGAPVMTEDGEAVGVHVRSSLTAVVVRVDPSLKFATRLDHALEVAGAALGTTFELVPSEHPVALLGSPAG